MTNTTLTAEDLTENIRRLDESLATFARLEDHYTAEISRLEGEITALEESVENVASAPDGGALARHDVRLRIIDSQLTLETHRHELAKLRKEIEETRTVREEAADALAALKE
jgi:chromosome segregation ATPase